MIYRSRKPMCTVSDAGDKLFITKSAGYKYASPFKVCLYYRLVDDLPRLLVLLRRRRVNFGVVPNHRLENQGKLPVSIT
jgi:hypothetical protein